MRNYLKKIKLYQPVLNSKLILILILLLAFPLRTIGLNWDQNQHLHPDERFLTMVVVDLKLPQSLPHYLNPKISSLNPYNVGYNFFVYGTFPLNLLKILGELTGYRDYQNIHLLGRLLSAFFDLGVVFLVFKINQKIFNNKAGLWAALFYSLMVLPIQLSHFFAVDTFLNFFILLSFYFLVLFITKPSFTMVILLGISFGFALACKISAFYFLPIIGIAFLYLLVTSKKNRKKIIILGVVFAISSYLWFRINQPSAFKSANFLDLKPNPQFVSNLRQLKSFNNPKAWYPPAVQWIKTKPIIFPLKNLILWGLGLPTAFFSIVSLFYTFAQTIKNSSRKRRSLFLIQNILIVLWVLGFFFYQSIQFVKTMRYFLPIYPFLALAAGNFLTKVSEKTSRKTKIISLVIHCGLVISLLIYPLSFISIYTRPTTRITASEWIYKNVPAGSTLANEHWDDPLPLWLPGYFSSYQTQILSLFDEESPQKWLKIRQQLAQSDFIILSSNRLYGSIPQIPERYPQTTQYYQDLFSGQLGFVKVAEFTSYPCFLPIGPKFFCFNDDGAEEAFTVYDHPKVIIFQKKTSSFGQKKN